MFLDKYIAWRNVAATLIALLLFALIMWGVRSLFAKKAESKKTTPAPAPTPTPKPAPTPTPIQTPTPSTPPVEQAQVKEINDEDGGGTTPMSNI